MLERAVKATVSGWRPWAIGAALSMAGAALLFFRANGHQPRSREGDRSGKSQLFV
jgi:hypothetical protein